MALPERRYSLDEYFLIEVSSPLKHEFSRGEIFAMSGASIAHNEITANLLTLLRNALGAGRCRAYASDLRIATPSGLLTYPDLAVICGTPELLPKRPDTATNPIVLIEVLSEATRVYDRGQKFAAYKTLPSLKEYLLIEQDRITIEHWRRKRSGEWASKTATRAASVLHLLSLDVRVALSDIYRGVALPAAPATRKVAEDGR
jgi:Uma2 family endonuclease